MKKIAILGSTGSVGRQTLDVIRNHPDQFRVVGLACYHQSEVIREQIKEFKPEIVSIVEKDGEKAILDVAVWPSVDLVVVSVVGMAGLLPTLAAIKAGKEVALATKEVMVSGGDLVKKEAKKAGVNLIPIDSEHSAIFQCLQGENIERIKKIYLTCSGGPFRGKTKKDLIAVSAKQALKHPNWKMGQKITIDSATLMNKGLELIEAMQFFDLKFEQIEVVVHPQSIIHSMVEFVDGNIMAQLGPHDMRLPIQYSLNYPQRISNNFPKLNFSQIKQLTFEKPDRETFISLRLAEEAARQGGTLPCVLNASNEIAVNAFLKGKIKFLEIPEIIEKVMKKHQKEQVKSLNQLLEIDLWARKEAELLT